MDLEGSGNKMADTRIQEGQFSEFDRIRLSDSAASQSVAGSISGPRLLWATGTASHGDIALNARYRAASNPFSADKVLRRYNLLRTPKALKSRWPAIGPAVKSPHSLRARLQMRIKPVDETRHDVDLIGVLEEKVSLVWVNDELRLYAQTPQCVPVFIGLCDRYFCIPIAAYEQSRRVHVLDEHYR